MSDGGEVQFCRDASDELLVPTVTSSELPSTWALWILTLLSLASIGSPPSSSVWSRVT